MTIECDPERQRATHIESGMAVEFDRYGPHAQERDIHFRLICEGKTIPFSGVYDFGETKIDNLYPDLSVMEQRQKRLELNEENFTFNDISVELKSVMQAKMPDFPKIFVELICAVVSKFPTPSRKSVYFRPLFNLSHAQWSDEG
jgi:hypothetical protein